MQKLSNSDVQVTREDQNSINNFSKFFQKRQDIEEALVKLKEKVNQHTDTLEELMMADDD